MWAAAVADLRACLPLGSLQYIASLDTESCAALVAEALAEAPVMPLVVSTTEALADAPVMPLVLVPAASTTAMMAPTASTTLVPQPLVRINAAIAALSAPVPDAWRPLVTEERAVAWRLFSFVYLMRRLFGDGVKKANGPAEAAAMRVATSVTMVLLQMDRKTKLSSSNDPRVMASQPMRTLLSNTGRLTPPGRGKTVEEAAKDVITDDAIFDQVWRKELASMGLLDEDGTPSAAGMRFARGETTEDPAAAIAAARREGTMLGAMGAAVGAMGAMAAASDLAQQAAREAAREAAQQAAAEVDVNAAVREEAAEQRRQEAAQQAAARELAARDAAEQQRQTAAREAAREAAAQQRAQHEAVLSAVSATSSVVNQSTSLLVDELCGIARKVSQVERVALPIAESVERLAAQAQAQAQPAACSRPGSRARPAGYAAGNDENRPPMRFGLHGLR